MPHIQSVSETPQWRFRGSIVSHRDIAFARCVRFSSCAIKVFPKSIEEPRRKSAKFLTAQGHPMLLCPFTRSIAGLPSIECLRNRLVCLQGGRGCFRARVEAMQNETLQPGSLYKHRRRHSEPSEQNKPIKTKMNYWALAARQRRECVWPAWLATPGLAVTNKLQTDV